RETQLLHETLLLEIAPAAAWLRDGAGRSSRGRVNRAPSEESARPGRCLVPLKPAFDRFVSIAEQQEAALRKGDVKTAQSLNSADNAAASEMGTQDCISQ